MQPRRLALAMSAILLTTPLAASTDAVPADWLWGRICTFGSGSARITPHYFRASSTAVASCNPPPAGYQSLSSTGGFGDASVNLAIGADPSTQRLCFAATGLPDAPVLRVGVGHSLSVQIANTLQDSGALNETNCLIATYGEGVCVGQPSFQGVPGKDGAFYPMEANQAELADGTSNLHVHGLFVTPQPCSDEVLYSTIYPSNWQGPVSKPFGCQTAPDTLTYTYHIPADHPAGLYWYHTHRHAQSEVETQMGLAGAIVVQDAGDAWRASIGVTDEVLLVTDYPKTVCQNPGNCENRPAQGHATRRQPGWGHVRTQAATPPALDPRIDQLHQAGECAAGAVDQFATYGGDELWKLKLNGADVPESYPDFPPDSALLAKTMQPGQRQIFRMVNASADSFLAPQLVQSENGVDTVLPMEVFARDGVGIANGDGVRKFLTIGPKSPPLVVPPSGRLEFVVHAPPAGATLYLQDNRVIPGCGGNAYPPRRLLRITSEGQAVDPGRADDSDLLEHTPSLRPYLNSLGTTATVHRTFVLAEYGRSFTYGLTKWIGTAPNAFQYNPNATDFFITEVASDDGEVDPKHTALVPFSHTGAPQVVVHLHGQKSVTEEWLVENSTLEIHAFHMHQIHFRDITKNSTALGEQPLLDVVNVPAAPLIGDVATGGPGGAPGWVRLLMTFTQHDIGEFVYHCHILEHEDNGMMGKVKVVAD